MPVDEILAKDPKAIILSGGPASVFEPGAPTIDTKVFESGVPVLGICYGFQVMAYELGGKVDKAALGEYGKTQPPSTTPPASSPTPPPSRPRG